MASHSAPANPLADPSHQQGMSPSPTPIIEGELTGPDYGRTVLEPLRDPPNEIGRQGTALLANGVSGVAATTGGGTLLTGTNARRPGA